MILFPLIVLLVYYFFIWLKGVPFFYVHIPMISMVYGVMLFFLMAVPIDIIFYGSRYDYLYDLIYLYTGIFFIGVLLGFLVVYSLIPSNIWKVVFISESNKEIRLLFLIYIISILFIFLLYYRMPAVPLFADDVHQARVQSLQGLGYHYKLSLYSLYFSVFGLSAILFRKKSFLKAFMVIVVAFIALLPTAIRIDSVFVLVCAVFSFLYSFGFAKNKLKYFLPLIIIFIFALLMFLAAMLQYVRHFGIDSFFSVALNELFMFSFGGVFHRFWVQLENFSYVYDYSLSLPFYSLFLNDILMAVPGSGVNETSGVLLKNELGLTFRGGGITPTFAGEGLAQFGFVGSLIYAYSLGFIISFLSPFFLRLFNKNIGGVSFLFIASFFMHSFATSTFFAVLIHSVIPIFVVYLFYNFTLRIRLY